MSPPNAADFCAGLFMSTRSDFDALARNRQSARNRFDHSQASPAQRKAPRLLTEAELWLNDSTNAEAAS